MKLFLDENLSPQHAAELRTEGYDAVAVLEVGLSGATDEQVLRFAVENRRVLVTLDSDFANVMRFRRALLYLQNIDIAGRLAVVDDDKIRIRH